MALIPSIIDLTQDSIHTHTKAKLHSPRQLAKAVSFVTASLYKEAKQTQGCSLSETLQEPPAQRPTSSMTKRKRSKKHHSKIEPPSGYCVAGIDIGLKNFSICIIQQNEMPQLPTIVEWDNKNLYSDCVGGKIIKYEAADKLLHRLTLYLDQVGLVTKGWTDVSEVAIESQAVSTKAIQRVEAFVFAYFYHKHPHIKAKTLSASRKLALPGMNHTKMATNTYKARKSLAIQYARQFLRSVPEDCRFKHFLDPMPRGKKRKLESTSDTGNHKCDDYADACLTALYVLGTKIPL